eukprot:2620798-Amphidinium_carterae.1
MVLFVAGRLAPFPMRGGDSALAAATVQRGYSTVATDPLRAPHLEEQAMRTQAPALGQHQAERQSAYVVST